MMENERIIVSTTETVAGRDIAEVLGVVVGVAYSSWSGSYSHGYSEKSRISALNRLKTNALEIGADAVVGIRFDSVAFDFNDQGEYTAYGTAVKLR